LVVLERDMRKALLLLAFVAVCCCLAACGSDSGGRDPGPPPDDGAECMAGKTSCRGNTLYMCKDGRWVKERSCYPDYCVKMGVGWYECM